MHILNKGGICVKNRKFSVIVFASLLLIATSFIFAQSAELEKEENIRGSELSREEKCDLDNLMGQISMSLHDEKYGFVLDHAVLPNGNVEVIVRLGTKKVKEKTKKEVQQTANDVIKHNHFKPESFQINVTSFYSSAKEGNRFSQRLSYNDLMGEILQSLSEKGYDHGISSKVLSHYFNFFIR